MRSPSSRGRGLKYDQLAEYYDFLNVALFTRAWIEIADGLAVRVVYG